MWIIPTLSEFRGFELQGNQRIGKENRMEGANTPVLAS